MSKVEKRGLRAGRGHIDGRVEVGQTVVGEVGSRVRIETDGNDASGARLVQEETLVVEAHVVCPISAAPSTMIVCSKPKTPYTILGLRLAPLTCTWRTRLYVTVLDNANIACGGRYYIRMEEAGSQISLAV